MRLPAVLVPTLVVASAAGVGAQLPAAAAGRADGERAAVWGGAGLGLSSVGALLQLDFARHRAPRLLRGRLTAHSNLGGLGTQRDESVTEVSALVGRGAVCCGGNWGSASAGGGVVLGRLGSDAAQFIAPGLAAEAALISRRRPHIAVAAFANVNPERSFAGVSVSLLLGRMPFDGR